MMDTYLSLCVGLLLTIDDSVAHSKSFGQGSTEEEKDLQLVKHFREACKFCTRVSPVYKDELLKVISNIEAFDDGSLLNMSHTLSTWTTANGVLENMSKFPGLIFRLSALNMLHTLWEMLSEYCDPGDPEKSRYAISMIKYCILTMSHYIELMWKLSDMCLQATKNGDQIQDVYRLVEISTIVVGKSKSAMYRCYSSLFAREMAHFKTVSPGVDDFRNMTVESIERLDTTDETTPLEKVFLSRGFSHQFMGLSCKSLLLIRQESGTRAFKVSFPLFCLVAGYKYFEGIISKRITSESSPALSTSIRGISPDSRVPSVDMGPPQANT